MTQLTRLTQMAFCDLNDWVTEITHMRGCKLATLVFFFLIAFALLPLPPSKFISLLLFLFPFLSFLCVCVYIWS